MLSILGQKGRVIYDGAMKYPGKALNEIVNTESTLENYAKAKNVRIRFFDPREIVAGDEFVSPKVEEKLMNSVGVQVLKKGQSKNNERWSLVQYFNRPNENKSFIKEIYEKIQDFCGDTSPIENHRCATRDRLVEAGKITNDEKTKLNFQDIRERLGKRKRIFKDNV